MQDTSYAVFNCILIFGWNQIAATITKRNHTEQAAP